MRGSSEVQLGFNVAASIISRNLPGIEAWSRVDGKWQKIVRDS